MYKTLEHAGTNPSENGVINVLFYNFCIGLVVGGDPLDCMIGGR